MANGIPWHEDTEILARLEEVSRLLNQGDLTAADIAKQTGVSISTTRRDIARIDDLWTDASKRHIAEQRFGYERKGRKYVHWRRDPEIMVRLEGVAALMVQNAKVWQIAETFDVSYKTAERDIARVEELWTESSEREVKDWRARFVGKLEHLAQQAYVQYDKNGKNLKWLRMALDCERELMDLLGAKGPIKIAPTDPSGEKAYDGFTEDERVERVMDLLNTARARRDQETS